MIHNGMGEIGINVIVIWNVPYQVYKWFQLLGLS